jgi:sec-independent protein translocase protein TatB
MNILGFGLPELLIIGVLALIFIGPERLPDVARQVFSAYRQVRSLGAEWRDQVEREVGADLRGFTRDVNEGIDVFGRGIEREMRVVDAEIQEAQRTALSEPIPSAPAAVGAPAPPSEFPSVPAPKRAEDEDETAAFLRDYRPGVTDYRP